MDPVSKHRNHTPSKSKWKGGFRSADWFALATFLYILASTLVPLGSYAKGTAHDLDLAAKALRFEDLVETKVAQEHGMIPMLVRASDYQLPTAEDYKGAYRHRHLQGKTEAELSLPPMHVWRAWENTPTDTAYYLRAMSYKYLVTGDPDRLDICRRTLRALQYIYNLAVEKGEKGFLCKPYGGVYSNQTSSDQMQCVVWGLAAYYPVAPPEDLKIIHTLAEDFATFAIYTDYIPIHGYFARSAEDIRASRGPNLYTWTNAAIYLPLMHLAWEATGDTAFAETIERFIDLSVKEERFAVATGTFSAGGFGGYRNLYLPALLMEKQPAFHTYWRDSMLSNYKMGRTGILEDGTWPTAWTYDGGIGKMEPKELTSVGGGYGRTGRSSLFAMGCVAAQRWFPEEDMVGDARKILTGLDEETFRFVLPLNQEHPLPSDWVIESKLLDLDCLTGWLCAYWEGRYRGNW
ncbi:MAG: hypothetical protein O3C20_07870 [Verrucomicrobia bacterium]|nr:hypothetical protein [Verrucomicrobiota bacterium]